MKTQKAESRIKEFLQNLEGEALARYHEAMDVEAWLRLILPVEILREYIAARPEKVEKLISYITEAISDHEVIQ